MVGAVDFDLVCVVLRWRVILFLSFSKSVGAVVVVVVDEDEDLDDSEIDRSGIVNVEYR